MAEETKTNFKEKVKSRIYIYIYIILYMYIVTVFHFGTFSLIISVPDMSSIFSSLIHLLFRVIRPRYRIVSPENQP
jgi:hypothetical protein